MQIVLDKTALGNVATAVKAAKAEFCLDQYDACVKNAGNDANKLKACREAMGKCNE